MDRAPRGKLPQWYSCHAFLINLTLEQYRQTALQQYVDIDIEPSRTEVFSDNRPSECLNVFYVPAATKEALDSFIVDDSHLFHLPIYDREDACHQKRAPSLFRATYRCPANVKLFVFIVEPEKKLVCPQPCCLDLRKLLPYSAEKP